MQNRNMEIVEILGIKMEKITHKFHTTYRKVMENNIRLRPPTKKEIKKHSKLINKQRKYAPKNI
jgi:adenine specific DNA methylase Mod